MTALLLDTNVMYQVSGPDRAGFTAWADRHGYAPVVSAVSLWEIDARRGTDAALVSQAMDLAAGLPVRPAPVASLEEGKRLFAELARSVMDADGMGVDDPRGLALKWGAHALKRKIATDGFQQMVIDRLGFSIPIAAPDYFGRMLLDLTAPVLPHRNDIADFLIFLSLEKGDCLLTGDARFAARAERALAGTGFATARRAKFGNIPTWTS